MLKTIKEHSNINTKIIKKHSTLAALYMLYAVNPEDDKSADGYILDIAGKVESKDNYRLFPAASVDGWYKMDIVPVDTKDGKPVATYDVFMHQNHYCPRKSVNICLNTL